MSTPGAARSTQVPKLVKLAPLPSRSVAATFMTPSLLPRYPGELAVEFPAACMIITSWARRLSVAASIPPEFDEPQDALKAATLTPPNSTWSAT